MKARVIINIKDVDEVDAVRRVLQVMSEGKVSGDDDHYCYATIYKDGITVYCPVQYGTDTIMFKVWKEK
jgi:hypothetical protein